MTVAAPRSTPSAADIDAARLLLARLGVSPAHLLTVAADRAPAPTFAEYVPVVCAAVSAGTRRVYGSYWNKITEHWGDRRIDEPTPTEIHQLAEHLKANVVTRRNALR
jgi:integrase/recombinase XerC